MSPAIDHVMKITERPWPVMVRGAGSWLWDRDGKRYLDFVQGWAVNCLGHSPRVVLDALAAQGARLINCSPAYYNEPMARLAELLAEASGLDQVFLCNSGAEANEGAIKLARKWGARYRGGAYEIVTMHASFHGRTLATMAASGKPGWDDIFPPKAAVGCALLETVAKTEFLDAVVANGIYLMDRLRALAAELGHGEVRGRGLLQALELRAHDAKKVSAAALDHGLLVNAPRPDTLRFMPALTVSREEIDEMLTILRKSLGEPRA